MVTCFVFRVAICNSTRAHSVVKNGRLIFSKREAIVRYCSGCEHSGVLLVLTAILSSTIADRARTVFAKRYLLSTSNSNSIAVVSEYFIIFASISLQNVLDVFVRQQLFEFNDRFWMKIGEHFNIVVCNLFQSIQFFNLNSYICLNKQ